MSVAIVGMGYVGLPLAMEFAEAGIDVVGIDIDAPRIAALKTGTSHIEDVSDERLGAVLERCSFSTRMVDAHDADAVLIAVPTPLNANREPELGALLSVARSLGQVMRAGQTIVVESTTFPGTTRDYVMPLLGESGLRAGEDFALAFSPERVDPGRTDYTIKTTPKIVGGLTPSCTEAASAVYAQVCDQIVPVKIKSMVITEQKYDPLLNPVQAEVRIGLEIPNAAPPGDSVGEGALTYTATVKDAQAILNLAKAVELAIDIIPF